MDVIVEELRVVTEAVPRQLLVLPGPAADLVGGRVFGPPRLVFRIPGLGDEDDGDE